MSDVVIMRHGGRIGEFPFCLPFPHKTSGQPIHPANEDNALSLASFQNQAGFLESLISPCLFALNKLSVCTVKSNEI